jgi:hypothetical protein
LLFISQTNADAIQVYSISSTGALTAVQTVTTASAPGNMTTDGLGKYLYVCENVVNTHTGSQVLAYKIGSTGTLTAISGTFSFPMWQLQGDASGNYLIGTTGSTPFEDGVDDNHLYVFSINTTTNPGAITEVGSIVTEFSPFNIAVSPSASNEEFVYSFSVNDAGTVYNAIEGYQLNITTGVLTALSGSPFTTLGPTNSGGEIGLWGQFDQSGANLLVYANLGATNFIDEFIGTSAILTPLSVDSSGNLTEPLTTPAPLVTPGYWVVTDL